ncbi:glycoside hydrolase family 26 protein [Roseicyclus persicicus]|uniref:Beta-mannosidase n=1 Tax=Roseicyclus persicicus TaxID=2650661 RepID=A0A7X6H2M4_9RHOB|nr:glycosyl hydrolase [Roseibacterium persicicum]NKX45652.1 beta-mannosidase [Roseibacterium persicicum]
MTLNSRKRLFPAVLAGSLLWTAAGLAAPPGTLPFGVYDPYGAFSDDPDVSIEHLFLPWQDVYLPSLAEADAYASERGRSVLVTIEPWTWTRDERNRPEVLIAGIQAGDFDGNMATICGILGGFQSAVTVRWAHEMEDRSGQFIWAGWTPETYIAAYRRMVDVCRAEAPEVDFMWSPLGLDRFEEYYPGDDYVDVVGLSVFGLQPWEQRVLGGERSFREILEPRYERALQFGRPIVVAELGYVGDQAYVDRWTDDVRQDIEGMPALVAVIYFNQTEVYPWPDGFGLPDWRIGFNVLD